MVVNPCGNVCANKQRSLRCPFFRVPWLGLPREINIISVVFYLACTAFRGRLCGNIIFPIMAFITAIAVTYHLSHGLCQRISKVKDVEFLSMVHETNHINALQGLQVKHRAVVSKLPICFFRLYPYSLPLSLEYKGNSHTR